MTNTFDNKNRVLNITLTDVSFEAPNRVENSKKEIAPTLQQSYDKAVTQVPSSTTDFFIDFTVKVQAFFAKEEDVLFIAEVKQRALVRSENEDVKAKELFLEGTVYDVLYNHAREQINTLITSSGFPEYHLQFTSFEQLYLIKNAEAFQA